nr:MAG TPA: hypothetical protein [Caudoviricetes sp.]
MDSCYYVSMRIFNRDHDLGKLRHRGLLILR